MRIAFLYIAEAYQCYHAAAIALALANRPGVNVVNLFNDNETPRHLERIRHAHGAEPLPAIPLRKSWLTRNLQKLRRLGMWKRMVMFDNRRQLNMFDAIVAVENSVAALRPLGVDNPLMAYVPHGSGDRSRGFIKRIAAFDLVMPAGEKTARRMLDEGLITPETYALPGYVKLETAARVARTFSHPFANNRPIVLYNPHKAPEFESWTRFIEPMLAAFAAQDEFNLIVAPHIKYFYRRTPEFRAAWEARSTDTILIDLGSDRSVDTSYSEISDIYIGDVSSQIYEFLARPRPCIFLNAHDIDWRDDASFRNWHLGDVVSDPTQLMDAVRSAIPRHVNYEAQQEKLARETLGDRSPGAAERAADAMMSMLHKRATTKVLA
ncbi:glycerophosphotransferase [soil metagenome]